MNLIVLARFVLTISETVHQMTQVILMLTEAAAYMVKAESPHLKYFTQIHWIWIIFGVFTSVIELIRIVRTDYNKKKKLTRLTAAIYYATYHKQLKKFVSEPPIKFQRQ